MKRLRLSLEVDYPEYHLGPPHVFVVTHGRLPDSRMAVLVRSVVCRILSKSRREILEIVLMWLIGELFAFIAFIKNGENNER